MKWKEFFKGLFQRSKPVIKVAMWMYIEKEYGLTPAKAKLAAKVIKKLKDEDLFFEKGISVLLDETVNDRGELAPDPRDS